ncbi:hypothetical protein V6Z12_D11G386000 [Gossypium hirsutum]
MFCPFVKLALENHNGFVVSHHSCTYYKVLFSNCSLLLYREN